MKGFKMQNIHELRKTVSTLVAAELFNRQPQTLRKWACLENGPIRPIRVNGRLAWPVDEIAALLNGTPIATQNRGMLQ